MSHNLPCRIIFLNLVVDDEKVVSYKMTKAFSRLEKAQVVLSGRGERTRSPLVPTFCRPNIDKLETSFKSVECSCNELVAHLTRNFSNENKFSTEDFLANCRRQFSPSPSLREVEEPSASINHRKSTVLWHGAFSMVERNQLFSNFLTI